MKRNFTNNSRELDAKEHMKISQGRRKETIRWQNGQNHGAGTIERCMGSNAGRKEPEINSARPAIQHNYKRVDYQGEELEKQLLGKIEQAVALTNSGLCPSCAAEPDTTYSVLDGAHNAPLSARLAPSTHLDASAGHLVRLSRHLSPTPHPDKQTREHKLGDTSVPTDDGGKLEEEQDGHVDWDSVPISQAICCTGPQTVWNEQTEREMREAALMPLPDHDEEDGGGRGRVKWVFERAGQGIKFDLV